MIFCCDDENMTPKERQLRKMAFMRVIYKKHFIVYIAVIAFLFIVNLITTPGMWWVLWPAAGWGLGLFLHGLFTYGAGSGSMVEKEYEKLKKQHENIDPK